MTGKFMKAISSPAMTLSGRRGGGRRGEGGAPVLASPSRNMKFPKELGYVMGSYCDEAREKGMPQITELLLLGGNSII